MSSINPSLPAKVFKFTPRTFYVNKFKLSDNTSPHLILIKTKFNDSINLQGPPTSKSVRFYTIPTPATIKSNFNKYSKKRHQCIGRIIYFFFELLFVIYSVSVFIDAPELCRERFPHCYHAGNSLHWIILGFNFQSSLNFSGRSPSRINSKPVLLSASIFIKWPRRSLSRQNTSRVIRRLSATKFPI